MSAKSATKTAKLVPSAPKSARKGAGRPHTPCAELITEEQQLAQIAEIARHIPQGATRPYVPMALEALTRIIKDGEDPAARASAAEVLMDFYGSPLGATFAPQSTTEAARDELLGETKAN